MIAVGIDLVDTDRISAAMRRTDGRFAGSFLAPTEAPSADADPTSARELAARFALKEACMKALGTGLARGVAFRDVVVEDPLGKPTIALEGGAAERSKQLGVAAIHATVSVSGGVVAAVVVLEGAGNAA